MALANVGGTGVGSELLPSHGRSLLHPVHESWKAYEATNIWKNIICQRKPSIYITKKGNVTDSNFYNRITLPIIHYYYFYTILLLLLVTFSSLAVGSRRPFIHQLHRGRRPKKV
jgi:hypothetical protein